MNEIYQIGFGIAEKLNHKQIFAIDWMGTNKEEMDFGRVYNWANENQKTTFTEIFRSLPNPVLSIEKSIYFKRKAPQLLGGV